MGSLLIHLLIDGELLSNALGRVLFLGLGVLGVFVCDTKGLLRFIGEMCYWSLTDHLVVSLFYERIRVCVNCHSSCWIDSTPPSRPKRLS